LHLHITFYEVVMHPNPQSKRMTMAQERKWLLELARERQLKSPSRVTPEWIVRFWRGLTS
jgi:hypothetical protein